MKVQTRPKSRPRSVYSAVALCDAGLHEATLTTDGVRAYVVSDAGLDEMPVLRNGSVMTVACPAETRGIECGEELRWNVLDGTPWSTDDALLDLVTRWAEPVELHDDDPENPIVRDRG